MVKITVVYMALYCFLKFTYLAIMVSSVSVNLASSVEVFKHLDVTAMSIIKWGGVELYGEFF